MAKHYANALVGCAKEIACRWSGQGLQHLFGAARSVRAITGTRNQRDGTQVEWTAAAPSLWLRVNSVSAAKVSSVEPVRYAERMNEFCAALLATVDDDADDDDDGDVVECAQPAAEAAGGVLLQPEPEPMRPSS